MFPKQAQTVRNCPLTNSQPRYGQRRNRHFKVFCRSSLVNTQSMTTTVATYTASTVIPSMSRPTIAIAKFVGVCSLGLLTGISVTTSYASIKSLLTLPSAPSAHRSFAHHISTLSTITAPLSIVSTLSLLASYFLSPPHRQHPYLLLTAMTPLFAAGYSFITLKPKAEKLERLIKENGEKGVNGEELRNGMIEWEKSSWGNVGFLGLGFGMGVVGVWGDSA